MGDLGIENVLRADDTLSAALSGERWELLSNTSVGLQRNFDGASGFFSVSMLGHEQIRPFLSQPRHIGRRSSHFLRRTRQQQHPVLVRFFWGLKISGHRQSREDAKFNMSFDGERKAAWQGRYLRLSGGELGR